MVGFDYQEHLKLHGFVVFATPLKKHEFLCTVQTKFDEHFTTSPELNKADPSDLAWCPVLGGFGATGNPSSFHHLVVRRIRSAMQACILDKDVLPIEGANVEQLFDRIMRRVGDSSTEEAMHRDESPNAKNGDTLFGGWLNLDSTSQTFLCAPKTHRECGSRNSGFAKIRDPVDIDRMEKRFTRVEVPSGHCIVFYQRLVHKTVNAPSKHVVRRMFLGWRVTSSKEPLFGTKQTLKWIEDQAVPKVKSAQRPQVWPSCYSSMPKNFERLETWSKSTFAHECLCEYTVKSGQCEGKTLLRVDKHMKSLREYELPMHKPYDEEDIAILFPQQSMSLQTFKSSKRKRFVLPTKQEWMAYKTLKRQAPAEHQLRRPCPGQEYDD